jgi:hypothetical protein
MVNKHHRVAVDAIDDELLEGLLLEYLVGLEQWQIPQGLRTSVVDANGETVVTPVDLGLSVGVSHSLSLLAIYFVVYPPVNARGNTEGPGHGSPDIPALTIVNDHQLIAETIIHIASKAISLKWLLLVFRIRKKDNAEVGLQNLDFESYETNHISSLKYVRVVES